MLIVKYDDHLPLCRQCEIFARSGVQIALSTLAKWVGAAGVALAPIARALKVQLLQSAVLHADESPVTVLDHKGKKHRGYIWAYASGEHEAHQAVVFQIKDGRSGLHAREFLRHAPDRTYLDTAQGLPDQASPVQWSGHLVVDGYAGYAALFEPAGHAGMTAVGCWVHLRRNFFELHAASKSTLARQALDSIGQLYATRARNPRARTRYRWHDPGASGARKAAAAGVACMAAGAARQHHRQHAHGQGDRLCHQALGIHGSVRR